MAQTTNSNDPIIGPNATWLLEDGALPVSAEGSTALVHFRHGPDHQSVVADGAGDRLFR